MKRTIVLKEHTPGSDVVIQPSSDYIKLTDGTLEQSGYRRFVCDEGFIRTPIDGTYDYLGKQSKDVERIYFLGDTVVENLFINDQRRFPALIEQRLKDKQCHLASMNGGCSGATSLHLLTVVYNKILNMADRGGIIFFIVPSNDAIAFVQQDGYWFKYSRISPIGRSKKGNGVPLIVRRDVTQLQRLLRVLASTVACTKFKLVLATSPFRDNDYEADPYLPLKFSSRASWDSLRSRRRAIVEITKSFASENGIPLVDLYAQFAGKTEYFYDDVNLNDRAQDAVADYICDELLAKQLIRKESACVPRSVADNFSETSPVESPTLSQRKAIIPKQRHVRLKEMEPDIDKIFIPTADYLGDTDGSCPGIPYRLRTDADGYIVDGGAIDNSADQRIVFLGDSFVESLYIDEKKRFVASTEEKLNSLGMLCKCLNSGYSGSTSLHLANIIINKIGVRKRTTIVFVVPYNDVLALQLNGTYWSFGDRRVTPILPWSDANARASALNTDELSRIIKIINIVCREFGLHLLCATFPHRIAEFGSDEYLFKKYSNHPGLYDDRLNHRKRVNGVLRQECQFYDIPLLDLEANLKLKPDLFYDEIHMNSQGSEFVSELFAEFIMNNRFPL